MLSTVCYCLSSIFTTDLLFGKTHAGWDCSCTQGYEGSHSELDGERNYTGVMEIVTGLAYPHSRTGVVGEISIRR